MKKAAILVSLCFFLTQISAQNNLNFFQDSDSANHSNGFKTDFLTFFKNNEYTYGVTSGYTLIGNQLKALISISQQQNIRFDAGFIYNKFFWTDSAFFEPLLRIDAKFNKFRIVTGNIYPNANHKMLSQIYSAERIMTKPAEHGIQLFYSANKWQGQLWLDWWRFIFYKSPHPENFNVGGNYFINIYQNKTTDIKLNYQMVFAHTGGEIDSSSSYTVTIYNDAFGLITNKKFDTYKVSIEAFILNYKDLTKTQKYPFTEGQASYLNLYLQRKNYTVNLGYWQSQNFIAPNGEMYFGNFNFHNNEFNHQNKYIIFGIDYQKTIGNLKIKTGVFSHFTETLKINYGYYLYMRYIFSLPLKP